jgi:hypothetical protein
MFFVSFNSNTTGVTSGAGTVHPSVAAVFTPRFSEICVAESFVFVVLVCLVYDDFIC